MYFVTIKASGCSEKLEVGKLQKRGWIPVCGRGPRF